MTDPVSTPVGAPHKDLTLRSPSHTHTHTLPSQPHPCAVIGPKFYGRRPRMHGSALPALRSLLLPNQLADLTAGPAGYCNVGKCLPLKVRLVHFSCGGLRLKPSWLNCQERTFLCAACDSGCPSQRLSLHHVTLQQLGDVEASFKVSFRVGEAAGGSFFFFPPRRVFSPVVCLRASSGRSLCAAPCCRQHGLPCADTWTSACLESHGFPPEHHLSRCRQKTRRVLEFDKRKVSEQRASPAVSSFLLPTAGQNRV